MQMEQHKISSFETAAWKFSITGFAVLMALDIFLTIRGLLLGHGEGNIFAAFLFSHFGLLVGQAIIILFYLGGLATIYYNYEKIPSEKIRFLLFSFLLGGVGFRAYIVGVWVGASW